MYIQHVLLPCAPLMQEQCPWRGSFPPRLLPPAPPWLSHHPCIPPSFLYHGSHGKHGSWAGRAAPSCPSPPRSWETSGPHIREDQPANLTSLDVTSRGPSLRLVFALGGPHRLSSASLLRLRKSSPHPQTSSRAQPVTTSRCDTVLSDCLALRFYLESQADHTVPCHPGSTNEKARHDKKEKNIKPR